jgi:hypothetical protein
VDLHRAADEPHRRLIREGTVQGPAIALTPAPLVPPGAVGPASARKPAVLPSPDDAKDMRPRLGATVRSTRPLLRWRKVRGATLSEADRLTAKSPSSVQGL